MMQAVVSWSLQVGHGARPGQPGGAMVAGHGTEVRERVSTRARESGMEHGDMATATKAIKVGALTVDVDVEALKAAEAVVTPALKALEDDLRPQLVKAV